MKPLRKFFDRIAPHFEKGGKLEKLYPLYEVIDTFFYTPGGVAKGRCHVRDAIDFKRMMSTVLVALIPCVLMAMYNTGLQANTAMQSMGVSEAPGWRGAILAIAGVGHDPGNVLANVLHGALYFIPVYVVCMAVGIGWEVLFAVVRGHEVNEGFFVTGLLFPLTLPPTIPLWQVAIGISFGVVIGKEIFGGTGRNILNPALTGRAFLFFAYPANMSGDRVWTLVQGAGQQAVDAVTAATPLALTPLAASGETVARILGDAGYTFQRLFIGNIPGSVGETSALMCLVGAFFLVITGVGNFRNMVGGVLGALAVAYPGYLLYQFSGGEAARMFSVHPTYHLVMGSFAFGMVYMATDPVSSPGMNLSCWIYGFLIGALTVMIRVFNPAYPEGVMLAILLMNIFAPLIDHFVIKARLSKRVPNV